MGAGPLREKSEKKKPLVVPVPVLRTVCASAAAAAQPKTRPARTTLAAREETNLVEYIRKSLIPGLELLQFLDRLAMFQDTASDRGCRGTFNEPIKKET